MPVPQQKCRHMKLSEIQRATNDFDESLVIGAGWAGKIYKAQLDNGVTVAVKRLYSVSKKGAPPDWPWPEVQTITSLRHPNIVPLLGYCNHAKQLRGKWPYLKRASPKPSGDPEMILVYEYIPNGTLQEHLHVLRTRLSWKQRLNICIDVARGLHYLHTRPILIGIQTGVMHGDLKSCNILLTETLAAKVSDFGLSTLGPKNEPCPSILWLPRGNFGYLDPLSLVAGMLTTSSDVFAFGMVMLEVLFRKPVLDESRFDSHRNLHAWVKDSVKEKNLEDLIDSYMSKEASPECLKEFFGIAQRCLNEIPRKRPDMAEVLGSLEALSAFDSGVQL